MHKLKHLFIVCFAYSYIYKTAISNIVQLGCYSKNNVIDFKLQNSVTDLTVEKCIDMCQYKTRKLAGLFAGNSCLCGEFYRGGSDPEKCTITCAADENFKCGGPNYVSIYESSDGALSSPQNLSVIQASETGIQVKWDSPTAGLTKLKEYRVSAIPERTYNERVAPKEKSYKFSPLTRTAFLDGLTPGTKYKIAVQSYSEEDKSYPTSILTWTSVGKPERPQVPELLTKMGDTMIVQLKKVTPTGGPITSYQIIVVDETLPILIDFDSLDDYHTALQQNLPYYIVAELTPEQLDTVFKVGDGKNYGKYFNAPLKKNVDYHILLGVTSTLNETKTSYSLSTHSQHESSDLHIHASDHQDIHTFDVAEKASVQDGTVLGLVVAIGFLGFILLAAVAVYFGLKIFLKKQHRRSVDHQELAVHAQTPNEDVENSPTIAAQYVDNEQNQPDYYRVLRQKVSIFSPHHLTIISELGSGKFGVIKKALILENHLGINPRNALIHQIQDSSLQPKQKNDMLKLFDQHIKISRHENVISLLGLVEDLNIISLVFEYENTNLKNLLEESRAVQHYPVYAEKNRRFSTLQEAHILGMLADVAKGLCYMHSKNIAHGNLCARSILLYDGTHVKISNFALLEHHNNVFIPDYCRWQAPEYLKTKRLTCPNDVWSFGCLMWEAVTLGGTPYADVRTEEIQNRIIRGLRLLQPQYVSDDLYQIMLLCWQNDPSERPVFAELESLLHKLIADEVTPQLLFSLYQSFSYEPFSKHLEFLD